MKRKSFIKTCGFSCAGVLIFGGTLQSCSTTKIVSGHIENEDIVINTTDFLNPKDNTFRKYILVKNEQLKYPISVYRITDTEYKALWMQCTHQGTELNAYGDRLQCSAHGSEFDKNGIVTNGPADKNLKTFPVAKENELLKISLKGI